MIPRAAVLLAEGVGDPGPLAPWIHENSVCPVGPWIPSETDLARIATDLDPGAGGHGPAMVLGALADDPPDLRTLQIAVALSAFFCGPDASTPAWKRWCRATPIPGVADRRAARAVARAPLAPWQIVSIRGDQVWLEDVVGLPPLAIPGGPVVLRSPGMPWGPPQPGGLLLARVARGPDGGVATCPIAVPGPLPEATERWLRCLTWLDRQDRGPLTGVGGILARHGHLLVRWILEHTWAP